jgi:serine phosphatase RsbU (regulator of sigma subunit)
VASAGHNPLIVWRAATGEIELVNPNGIALGLDRGPMFEKTIREQKLSIGVGDRLVLYTDGIVEARNADSELFGDQKTYDLVKRFATRDSNQLLNLCVKVLDEFKGDAPQHDDMTIVTARRV